MFKARSCEPDRDFCLDYPNIHSFVEVLADPEERFPRRKRKELAKEQKHAEMEREHESGSVSNMWRERFRNQTDSEPRPRLKHSGTDERPPGNSTVNLCIKN